MNVARTIMGSITGTLLAAALAVFPPHAHAAPRGECAPSVRDGWIRLVPGGMPMHAGFARIENGCAKPVVIAGAASPGYGAVELHETRIVDGVSRMRPVPRLRIAPGGAAQLQPGGLHLMLMRPVSQLKPGDRVAIEFALDGGGALRGEFEVRSAAP